LTNIEVGIDILQQVIEWQYELHKEASRGRRLGGVCECELFGQCGC